MYFFTFNIIRPEVIVWFALPWNLKIITHMLRHKIEARSLILRTKFCPSQGNERDNLARVKFGADWTTRWSRYQCPVSSAWWQKAGINCQNIHVFGEQRPNYVQWFISCLNIELFTVTQSAGPRRNMTSYSSAPRSSSALVPGLSYCNNIILVQFETIAYGTLRKRMHVVLFVVYLK